MIHAAFTMAMAFAFFTFIFMPLFSLGISLVYLVLMLAISLVSGKPKGRKTPFRDPVPLDKSKAG